MPHTARDAAGAWLGRERRCTLDVCDGLTATAIFSLNSERDSPDLSSRLQVVGALLGRGTSEFGRFSGTWNHQATATTILRARTTQATVYGVERRPTPTITQSTSRTYTLGGWCGRWEPDGRVLIRLWVLYRRFYFAISGATCDTSWAHLLSGDDRRVMVATDLLGAAGS
jgi:hypothetical protein